VQQSQLHHQCEIACAVEPRLSMNAHQRAAALRAVKVVHTVAWALFAGCILAIPAFAWQRRFQIVVVLGAAIFLEIGIQPARDPRRYARRFSLSRSAMPVAS
jgi:hypothetical protein